MSIPPPLAVALSTAAMMPDAVDYIATTLASRHDDSDAGATAAGTWTVREIARHVAVGTRNWADRFAAQVRGEPWTRRHDEHDEHDESVRRRFESMPIPAVRDFMLVAGNDMASAARELAPSRALTAVKLSFGEYPLWTLPPFAFHELVLHEWDLRVPVDPEAVIEPRFAVEAAKSVHAFAPVLAHHDAAITGDAFVLEVGGDIGAMTVLTRDNVVIVEVGAARAPRHGATDSR